MGNKRYLGDAIYAEYDHHLDRITLTTENGIAATNRIVIEKEQFKNFVEFAMDIANLWMKETKQ